MYAGLCARYWGPVEKARMRFCQNAMCSPPREKRQTDGHVNGLKGNRTCLETEKTVGLRGEWILA